MSDQSASDCQHRCVVDRRFFLGTSGTATTMLLSQIFPGRVVGQSDDATASVTTLPRKRIATLSELQDNVVVKFSYPRDGELHNCLLVKTGERAGGGVGEHQDVVAFSGRCTHLGGSLDGTYNGQHKVAGPCPLHLTTFDLTRHGMVVAGHATAALPQILLEVEDKDIFAVGIVGLLYGYSKNL